MKLFNFATKIFVGVILGNIIFSMCSENTNTNLLTNKNTMTEKTNLNSGIFLTEKVFKYKNFKKAKVASANSNQSYNSLMNKSTKSSTNLKLKNNFKSPLTGPILHNGWIKFFKYSDGVINAPIPKEFSKNSEFIEQKKHFPEADLSSKDKDGFEFIRNDHYFYLNLFENSIAINSSKKDQSRKILEVIFIADIKDIFEDSKDNKLNGVLDYGKFNEGFCMKISTRDNEASVYIICTDTENEKNDLLKKIKALKLQEQHNRGVYLFAKPIGKTNETVGDLFGKKEEEVKSGNNAPIDGYWLTLQDWSQCSKKCDGGVSTYHRMCVPPKNGGKPCEGEQIMTKKCNTEPCPGVKGSKEDIFNKKNAEVLKPIVKIMPFTDSPQRFTLCKIKESDLMIYEDGKDEKKKDDPLFKGKKIDDIGGIRIPSRVVMNPSTLTVFSGQKFESMYLSFNLKKTRFYEAPNKKNCFKLFENSKKYVTLCPYNCEIDNKEFLDWRRDFDTFKTRCERPNKGLNDAEQKELDKKIKDKMDQAKREALDEAQAAQKLKKATQSQGDLAVLVKNTHSIAMKAIQKEQTLEDLIKQEAEEKNRLEEERIRKMIEDEKKKKDCVLKAIKEKELENQLQEKAKEIQDTINTIKQEAAAQVLIKRNNLKKVLNQINQKAMLKRNLLRQELQNVRMSIANELGKAYKKGDVNKCVEASNSDIKRINYCVSQFSDDFINLNYCKNTEEFCDLCCGSEFGEMLSNDKEKCMHAVCPNGKTINGKPAKAG